MTEFGNALSSEEQLPLDLVANARRAEEAGFSFALISDHYHSWVDEQGRSPFLWSVLGGISQAMSRLRLGTGVTCPRSRPPIVVDAAKPLAADVAGRSGDGCARRRPRHRSSSATARRAATGRCTAE